MDSFDNQSILITGGTGSFGQAMTLYLLKHSRLRRLIIFSRDECKQWQMQQRPEFQDSRLRFFLGDVRDQKRLLRAFQGVQIVIHAAALKQVPAAEYNPNEFIQTNVNGSINVIEAAIEAKVQRALLLSTDKAVSPINLYGASKLCAEKLFLAAGVYTDESHATRFSVLRYGNVLMSRGSVLELWSKLLKVGSLELPITDAAMTRFWITLEQATVYVHKALQDMQGGEVFVPRIPSMRLMDLAKAFAPQTQLYFTGVRIGEKLHEVLMSYHESLQAYEQEGRFIIIPSLEGPDYLAKTRQWWHAHARQLEEGFCFASNENSRSIDVETMHQILKNAGVC